MKICLFTDLRLTESTTPTGVGRHICQMARGLAGTEGNQFSVVAARDRANADRLHPKSTVSFLPSTRLPLPWKASEALWTLAGGTAVDSCCRGADWVYSPRNDFVPLSRTKRAVTIHGAQELDPAIPQLNGCWPGAAERVLRNGTDGWGLHLALPAAASVDSQGAPLLGAAGTGAGDLTVSGSRTLRGLQ